MANRFGGCFVWALAPFCVLFLLFAVCFAVSAGEMQVWLGDLQVVVFGWLLCFFVCCFNRFAASMDFICPWSLYKCLSSLFSCKDRAFSATSATLEEKKPKGHWRTPMPHCSKQNSLQAQSTSKIAEPYAACCCLKSLRIRVEARANVTEREVISRQLQLMQASVQHYPTEDLNTADTSCLSRISAGLCSEKNARISVSM